MTQYVFTILYKSAGGEAAGFLSGLNYFILVFIYTCQTFASSTPCERQSWSLVWKTDKNHWTEPLSSPHYLTNLHQTQIIIIRKSNKVSLTQKVEDMEALAYHLHYLMRFCPEPTNFLFSEMSSQEWDESKKLHGTTRITESRGRRKTSWIWLCTCSQYLSSVTDCISLRYTLRF